MNAEIAALCDRIVSALLNGTFQGVLLLAFIWLAIRLFPRTNAATRHAIGLVGLGMMAGLPVLYFLSHPPASRVDVRPEIQPLGSLVEVETLHHQNPVDVPAHEPLDHLAELPSVIDPGVSVDSPRQQTEPSPARLFYPPWDLQWELPAPRYLPQTLVLFWFAVALFRLARLGAQCWLVRRLKISGASASESTRELFSKLCVELNVSRAPQLRIVPGIAAPIAVGFKEPYVLLPASVAEKISPIQLEHLLRHELAHVVRRDDWANLVQQILRAIFFFHPGVWWVSRQLSVDREIACDDHVLAAIGGHKAYALLLTEFAARAQGRDLLAAPAAWSTHSQLKQRINMILDSKRNSSPRLARAKTGILTIFAVLLAVAAFQALPRLALAQDPPEAPPADPVEPLEINVSVSPKVTPVAPFALSVPVVEADISQPTPPAQPGLPLAAPRPAARARVSVQPTPARAPRLAVIDTAVGVPSGPLIAAGLPPEDGPDSKPAPAPKRRAQNDDALERRLERLERMVESLVKQQAADKKGWASSGNSNFSKDGKFNPDEFARMHEKMTKDAERAGREAEKMAKQMEARGDFDRFAKLGEEAARAGGKDGLKIQRKVLEQHRQQLEKQVQAIERQIEKLEHDQERMDEERSHEEEQRAREEKQRAREEQKREKAKEKGGDDNESK